MRNSILLKVSVLKDVDQDSFSAKKREKMIVDIWWSQYRHVVEEVVFIKVNIEICRTNGNDYAKLFVSFVLLTSDKNIGKIYRYVDCFVLWNDFSRLWHDICIMFFFLFFLRSCFSFMLLRKCQTFTSALAIRWNSSNEGFPHHEVNIMPEAKIECRDKIFFLFFIRFENQMQITNGQGSS